MNFKFLSVLFLSGCLFFDNSQPQNPIEMDLCGNGKLDEGEECEASTYQNEICEEGLVGNLSCNDTCTIDSSACTPEPCGNGRIDEGEDCDWTKAGMELFDNEECPAGTERMLFCTQTCTIEDSGCTPLCGNGKLDIGELCDDNEVDGKTCEMPTPFGELTCSDDCKTLDDTSCKAVGYTAVAVGNNHACGLKSDGTLSCWNLSDGTASGLPDKLGFKKISAGGDLTCGIYGTTQTLYCWDTNGTERYGSTDAGNNTQTTGIQEVRVGGDASIAVSRIVDNVSSTDCYFKGLTEANPTQICSNLPISSIDIYDGSSICGLNGDSKVSCWKTSEPPSESNAVPFFTSQKLFTQIALHSEYVLAIPDRNKGIVRFALPPLEGSTNLFNNVKIDQVDVGDKLVCVRRQNGMMLCKGKTKSFTPTDLKFVDLSVGTKDDVCAVTVEGSIHCWSPEEKALAIQEP